jgi:SAM-dependent methyltransferase
MHTCRFCNSELTTVFADLNMAPIVNNYVKPENRFREEVFYPLITYVCDNCKLVQTLDFNPSEQTFTPDYAYFSSYSTSWLEHCRKYVEMICKKLSLNEHSKVMEIASNDGYMLQYFKEKNIPLLGIEPSKSVADAAMAKEIDTVIDFFGLKLAKTLEKADLICMCNVLAHVPDINDFTAGIKEALKEKGTVTIEFPHLLNMMKYNQFDTIYLEHYSYLSLIFIEKLFNHNGLKLYDVEEIPTHGGSLRVYGCHANDNKEININVSNVLKNEKEYGLDKIESYIRFEENIKAAKRALLSLLIDIKNQGKTVVAYGAAAKGNTLFNYCGISYDFIDYSVDLNPNKQNTFLPGCHIPVKHPDEIKKTKPDYILITPWNIKDEIIKQLEYTKGWGVKFIVAIPEVKII